MKKSHIIIHHDVILQGSVQSHADSINRMHHNRNFGTATIPAYGRDNISSFGFSAQYHDVIEPNGKITHIRPVNEDGWHARGANHYGIGICLGGDMRTDKVTDAQYETLFTRCKQLIDNEDIEYKNIIGHNDVKGSSTLCPGVNVEKLLKKLRSDLGEAQEGLEVERDLIQFMVDLGLYSTVGLDQNAPVSRFELAAVISRLFQQGYMKEKR